MAELIVGIGWHMAEVERRITMRVVGSRRDTSVWRANEGGVRWVVIMAGVASEGFFGSHREVYNGLVREALKNCNSVPWLSLIVRGDERVTRLAIIKQ